MSVYRQCAWIAVMILIGLFGVAVGERDGSHTPTPHAVTAPHAPEAVTANDDAVVTWQDQTPDQWIVVLDRPASCTFFWDGAMTRPVGTVSSQNDVCLWAR